MSRRMFNRGDTIVEVVFAVTIFSMIAVGAISIMNKGVAIAQQSLEITLVRQQIDSQAEMLRYVHDKTGSNDATYASLWKNILRENLKGSGEVQQVVGSNGGSCGDVRNSFFLRPSGKNIVKGDASHYENPETYAKVENAKPYGISIQLTKGSRHYDAYIQACWYGPSGAVPTTMGTIVRLYDNDA